MPRSKEGKKRTKPLLENLENAKKAVLNGVSTRSAAKQFHVSRTTLKRFIEKETGEEGTYKSFENCATKRVFGEQEEGDLCKYLIKASKMHYGLHRNQLRMLAYQFALANQKQTPASWEKNQKAGKHWFRSFMRRHPDLSLRKPEPTSLSRATSFNRHNVQIFFNKLKEIMEKYKFHAGSIYNMDETANSTVHAPAKVIAVKGEKQVGSATSGERGQHVTMIACINAIGNSVPPMFIFPRVNFKENTMMHGAPPGSIGSAVPNGWSNSQKFLEWLNHFIRYTNPSKEHKKLLILDNHESHVSFEAVQLAKDSGIIMLTLPPHTSHKLQPLDRSVFGPFKRYYNTAADEWMLSHPSTPITIYNVAELAGKAYLLAFNPSNIQSGFKVSGIWPINENIFRDDEFLCSEITDRQNPETQPSHGNVSASTESVSLGIENILNQPSTSKPIQENEPFNIKLGRSLTTYKSPENIRPYPKAGPRKTVRRRKLGACRILTDTPEKDELERLYHQKMAKGTSWKKQFAVKAVKRKVLQEESSSDTNESEYSSESTSDDISVADFCRTQQKSPKTTDQEVAINKFCLTKLTGKKKIHFYVAEVVKIVDDDNIKVKYLKRLKATYKFIRQKDDVYDIMKSDVVMMLPDPDPSGLSERQKNIFHFNVDFLRYNVE